MRSTDYVAPFISRSSAVISASRSSIVPLFRRVVVTSAVRCRTVLLLLCFFERGHPRFRNFNSAIPVDVAYCVMCQTFAYDLSAFLANISSPLTGNSDFTVTNSAHFVFTISSEKIQDHEIMVSFDVESLFTNVLMRVRYKPRYGSWRVTWTWLTVRR